MGKIKQINSDETKRILYNNIALGVTALVGEGLKPTILLVWGRRIDPAHC